MELVSDGHSVTRRLTTSTVPSLLPREHGAYGQVILPVVTAFAGAGISRAGVLLAVAVVASFLAHEPATVLLGARGQRAKRDLQQRATFWLVACLVIAASAGLAALMTIAPYLRWSIAVPLVPAVVLASETLRGQEKSLFGETAASLAFAGTAFPIAVAATAPWQSAAGITIPFACLFVVSTMAVRVVILRTRGGGNPRATTRTRRTALFVVAVVSALLAGFSYVGALPWSVLVAATPGMFTSVIIATHPPRATRLRTLGWTLVAVSILTSIVIIATI